MRRSPNPVKSFLNDTMRIGYNRSRIMKNMLSIWMLVAVAATATAEDAQLHQVSLQQVLGADFAKAKVVGLDERTVIRDKDGVERRGVVAMLLSDGKPVTMGSWPAKGLRSGRASWSVDGRQIICAVNGECWTYGDPKKPDAALEDFAANGRRLLQDEYVTEACFWDDPKTGERCVVFCWRNREKPDREETSLYRPQSGEKIKLADGRWGAGMSRDGTHLGMSAGGGGVKILDLPNQKTHHLYHQCGGCNQTMCQDNSYRIMHLYAPHHHFGIRDKYDRELWKVGGAGYNWDRPRWSNSPDLCTVEHSVIWIIRISTKEQASIPGCGFTAPELWVPSGVQTPARPSPIEDLKLTQLADYKRKLAEVEDYSPIIAELKAKQSPEAQAIVTELEKQAGTQLAAAKAQDDATAAIGELNCLAARYAGHPAGRQAREILESAAFQAEYHAARVSLNLAVKENEMRDVKDARRSYNDPAFFERNKGSLGEMANTLGKLRKEYPNTRALARAEAIARKYELPGSVVVKKERLALMVTITKVSRVPTFTEIKPYKDALTYVRMSVDKIDAGTYANREIMVVDFVVKDNTYTPVAQWKPGQKLRLELERLDLHPEIGTVYTSQDEDDLELVPYLAVKVLAQ